MLYYESGYICDTSTGTRQVVSRQELTHYLSLGLDIKGVDGGDWRYANRTKLEALSGTTLTVAVGDGLVEVVSPNPSVFSLSEVASGFGSYLCVSGAFTVILDNTLDYGYFTYAPLGNKGIVFDLRKLSTANTVVVYISLVTAFTVVALSQGKPDGVSHIKVDSESTYPLILLGILANLDFISDYDKDLVIYNTRSNYTVYKDGVVPYLEIIMDFIDSVDIVSLLPALAENRTYLMGALVSNRTVLKRLDLILSNAFIADDKCRVYLNVLRSYVLIFNKLPKCISKRVNRFITNFIVACDRIV
jgi:hypothetical protein